MKLNADLGEHEPPARTRALMRLIDLANIACGVHAGSVRTMERCVKLAIEHGVAIGAHPGIGNDSGRGAVKISPAELEAAVIEQANALAEIASRAGAKTQHVKLHGALYHATEKSPALASRYVETVREHFPKWKIIALAGGRVAALAGKCALAEVFADRGYRPDGTLVPRGEPGDLIADSREAARQMAALRGDTVCVHADSPNALRIARAMREMLGPRR